MGLFPSDISDHIDVVQHFITGDGWLSEYFNQRNDERITLINADIEGFEMDMLKELEKIIKRDRPVLAISVYHKKEDVLTIK
nr:FkbM family methyltransferase [uncultured Schaedlerella sp.]